MFTRQTDAGKISLIALCKQLELWSFALLDCQVSNPHLKRMGAVNISRKEFEIKLAKGVSDSRASGTWTDDFSPDQRWLPVP